jgi:hypothetical protein
MADQLSRGIVGCRHLPGASRKQVPEDGAALCQLDIADLQRRAVGRDVQQGDPAVGAVVQQLLPKVLDVVRQPRVFDLDGDRVRRVDREAARPSGATEEASRENA